MQEEEERDYKQLFPDHSAAFTDVALLPSEEELLEPMEFQAAASTGLATDAEAGSSAARDLMSGELLDDVVELHRRIYSGQESTGELLSRLSIIRWL